MFRLEGDGAVAAAAAARFKTALEALPGTISALKAMEVHVNDVDVSGNWTVMLHAQCPDKEALSQYASNPEHLACVAIIKPLIAARACVDYTV